MKQVGNFEKSPNIISVARPGLIVPLINKLLHLRIRVSTFDFLNLKFAFSSSPNSVYIFLVDDIGVYKKNLYPEEPKSYIFSCSCPFISDINRIFGVSNYNFPNITWISMDWYIYETMQFYFYCFIILLTNLWRLRGLGLQSLSTPS